jgi:hypothetical protein
MAIDPKELSAMNDHDLQHWALSGGPGSYVHEIGRAAMDMRCSLRMIEASNRMVTAMRNVALAIWGVVIITLITQIALILLALKK